MAIGKGFDPDDRDSVGDDEIAEPCAGKKHAARARVVDGRDYMDYPAKRSRLYEGRPTVPTGTKCERCGHFDELEDGQVRDLEQARIDAATLKHRAALKALGLSDAEINDAQAAAVKRALAQAAPLV